MGKAPRRDGKLGVWDEDDVQERSSVWRSAQKMNVKANVGLIFAALVEENHELPRAVFQGNNVWDEKGNWSIFQELGSRPATMEAARSAEANGLMPGHSVQQADAEQAYTQAELDGTPTWVRLPRDQWAKAWSGDVRPRLPPSVLHFTAILTAADIGRRTAQSIIAASDLPKSTRGDLAFGTRS